MSLPQTADPSPAAHRLARAFDDHRAVLDIAFAALAPAFERLATLAGDAIAGGGKLLFFGNGGSAGDAQHLATELTVRFEADRRPLPALALTTDTSTLTAIGNDLGFEQLFARQVAAIGRPGDLAIGLSTSGRSPNVLRGLEAARTAGLTPAALSGGSGGDLVGLADPLLVVPSTNTARIQEIHILLGHVLCGVLEERFAGG